MSGPPANALVRVERLSKRFGTTRALEDVSLALGEGEVLVVLGPTGAGKTTLLRTIAGLEAADSGRVLLGGTDVTELPPAARDVALVFQNFSLYPRWTVRANLEFPLRAPGRNLSAAEIAERVAWAADLLRIEPLLARDARWLSGGEMQRVALGRALVRRPRLFLMDEPLSNLDAKLREALRVELVALVRRVETPMIYVTHDQGEALSMASRVAVLAAGRVLQVGTPDEVYRRPISPAVARQLGHPPINLLPARRSGTMWHTHDGIPLAPAPSEGPAEALLGIRPEHVRPTGGAHPARIEVVEEAGHAKIVVARLGSRTLHALVPRSFAGAPGETIRPSFDASAVLCWTGEAASSGLRGEP
jgi:multiple sugar transport system ATP-binding protein